MQNIPKQFMILIFLGIAGALMVTSTDFGNSWLYNVTNLTYWNESLGNYTYVPYTGAVNDVNIGLHSLTVINKSIVLIASGATTRSWTINPRCLTGVCSTGILEIYPQTNLGILNITTTNFYITDYNLQTPLFTSISTGFKFDKNNVTISELAGSGNAYACLDANGQLYRSATACV